MNAARTCARSGCRERRLAPDGLCRGHSLMRAWRAKQTWTHLLRGLALLGALAWILSASASYGWRQGIAALTVLAVATALVLFVRARRTFALLSRRGP